MEGTVESQREVHATFSAEITYTVDISGRIETSAGGRVLHIVAVPSVISLDSWSLNNIDLDEEYLASLEDALTSSVAGWDTVETFTMDLPAIDSGSSTGDISGSSGYSGTATLTR